MQAIAYPASVSPDEDGRVLVTLRDFPYAATDGADRAEALTEATDLLESVLAFVVGRNESLPNPSPAEPEDVLISPSATTAAQVALYSAMRRENVSAEQLAERLGMPGGDVQHLIDLAAYPPLPAIERALAALGQRLTLTVEAAE
jgi:antitoxin HicB